MAASQSSKRVAALENFRATMDKIKFIFATRNKLTELGFPNVARCFSHKRRVAAHQFRDLAQSQPEVYGEIGSDSWIRGYLCHLNEPGEVSWDDVVYWLRKHDFLFNAKVDPVFCNKKKLVPATIGGGHVMVCNIPRLKHALICLWKCDDKPTEGKEPQLTKPKEETSTKRTTRIKRAASPQENTSNVEYDRQALQSDCSARCSICVMNQTLAGNFGRLADITSQLLLDSRKPEFRWYKELRTPDLYLIRHVYLKKKTKYQNEFLECVYCNPPILTKEADH